MCEDSLISLPRPRKKYGLYHNFPVVNTILKTEWYMPSGTELRIWFTSLGRYIIVRTFVCETELLYQYPLVSGTVQYYCFINNT